MMKHIPAILLLCLLAVGCHHASGPVLTEQEALNTKALAAALHFAYQVAKRPADTSLKDSGNSAGITPEIASPGQPEGNGPVPPPQALKPRFEARMPPQGTGRKIVLFLTQSCFACRPTRANFESFAKIRGLDAPEWGIVDLTNQQTKYEIPSVPTIILIDSQGKELNRITGLASFEQIEDLWLSGKRPHNLNGLPLDRTAFAVSPDLESIMQELPKLVKSAGFNAALSQQFNIPLPGVGEIVIPQTLSIQAGPISGGFKVAVESGTPAPWVRSKWMGSLYPIPITAVSVVGKKATVELRGWQYLVISLEGP